MSTILMALTLVALPMVTSPSQSSAAPVGDHPTLGATNTHACKVVSSTVECWGHNELGQLGDGTVVSRNEPRPVVGLTGTPIAVVAYLDTSCALLVDGRVQCWGSNQAKSLGTAALIGFSSVPVDVVLAGPASALAASAFSPCVVLEDGRGQCWGNRATLPNLEGYPPNRAGVTPPFQADIDAIALKEDGVCLLIAGEVKCTAFVVEEGIVWTSPIVAPSGREIVDIAIDTHSYFCVQYGDGGTECRSTVGPYVWGSDLATADPFTEPVEKLLRGGCALLVSGPVECLVVGEGTPILAGQVVRVITPQLHVVRLPAQGAVADFERYFTFTCSLRTDGSVTCPQLYTPPPPEPCADEVFFIGVRGSGQNPQGANDADELPYDDDVPTIFRGDDGRRDFARYFLTHDNPDWGMGAEVNGIARLVGAHSDAEIYYMGLDYVATRVAPEDLADYPQNYRDSVDGGAENLVEALHHIADACGSSEPPRVVLAGYSQGAHVIQDALAAIYGTDTADLITKVTLVGSPLHATGRGDRTIGEANTPGSLLHLRKQGADNFAVAHGNVDSLCAFGDLVCDSGNARAMGNAENLFSIRNSTGAQIHTAYTQSWAHCALVSERQPNMYCGANSVLSGLGEPLIGQGMEANPALADDLVHQGVQGEGITLAYGAGMAFPSPLQSWLHGRMFSDPIDLGPLPVTEEGVGIASITIPNDIPVGIHRLAIIDGDGRHSSQYIRIHARGRDIPTPTIVINVGAPDTESLPGTEPTNPTPPASGGSLESLFGS